MYTPVVRSKVIKIFLFCFLCTLFSIGLFVAINKIFAIQIIEVVGNSVSLQIDEKKIIKTLLFFPSDRFRAEILSDNTYLADVQFQKIYPHTLKIIPVTRAPSARLQVGGRIVLLDKLGYVLSDGDQGFMLPLIVIDLPFFRVGEKLTSPRVQTALSIIEALRSDWDINSLTEVNESYFLVKTPKTDIFIAHNGELGEILTTLQTLLAGFRIKGTLPAVVDLRFDKPVIKF
jgi:hypothetical protein